MYSRNFLQKVSRRIRHYLYTPSHINSYKGRYGYFMGQVSFTSFLSNDGKVPAGHNSLTAVLGNDLQLWQQGVEKKKRNDGL